MARHRSILNLRGSLANRDRVEDLALTWLPSCRGAGVPKVMLPAEVLEQVAFEDAAALNE